MNKKRPAAPVTITCRTCGGGGTEELPHAYRDVYEVLTSSWQPTSTLLAQLKGVEQTTLANRLAYLKKLGLADSRPIQNNYRTNEWRRL